MSELDQQLRRGFGKQKVRQAIGLFAVTGNGLDLWDAYRACREYKLPIPELILEQFDLIAAALADAENGDDALRALNLKQEKGGNWKHRQQAAWKRRHDTVRYVSGQRKAFPEKSKTAICREAKKQFGWSSPGAVKRLYSEVLKRPRRR